jgi:hypothetical protein
MAVAPERTANCMPGSKTKRPGRRSTRFIFVALLVCAVTVIVFFRDFFQSGFNLAAGDIGDNRFNIAILEHWWAVVHGKVLFTSPNFFWPEHGVLGYSDSLFLMSWLYMIGRATGLDYYLAFEIALIVFKAAGFFSMLWLLRSVAALSRPAALIGAVLFTLSNLYFISVGHCQLITVAFTPLAAALVCAAWREYGRGRIRVAHAYGVACGVLTALVLFTSFYIGWFTILTAAVFVAMAALVQVLTQRSFAPVSEWLRAAFARRWLFAVAALAFVVALIPFLITYLPTLKDTGGRAFGESLLYSAGPGDLTNVGPGNLVWGHLLKAVLAHPFRPGERMVGWPPFILLLTLGGAAVSLFQLFRKERMDAARHGTRLLLAACGASTLLLWVLSIRIGPWSLWWLVFKLVPGGAAIRAPARLNFVLNVLLVLAACVILEQLRNRRDRLRRAAFWGAAVLLIAEQINLAHTHGIHRAAENAILARVQRPPAGCASFFFTAPAQLGRVYAANQVDAMLVARAVNLPTINGYSGFLPPDWNLLMFDNDYIERALQWAALKHVERGLCGLDLRNGSWTTELPAKATYTPGEVLDFRKGGNAIHFEGAGWGGPEPGGAWTIGGNSVLELPMAAPPTGDLLLSLEAHAFTAPQRSHFDDTLLVNGRVAAQWTITDGEPIIHRQVRLPAGTIASRVLRIEFINHDPRSPADVALSPDTRKMGLALHTLRLDPAEYSPGEVLDFRTGGNGPRFEGEGWGGPEKGGSWTIGGHSVLVLPLAAPPTGDLVLSLEAHAFTAPQRNRFDDTLVVNGRAAAQWTITNQEPAIQEQVRLPAGLIRSRVLRIEFINHDPRSPADLGLSGDTREVGLALHTLRLDPALYAPGEVLDFRMGGNARYFEGEGWSRPERGGAWTIGGHSVLVLPLAAPPSGDLLLSFEAHGFTPPERSRFDDTLLVNGRVAAQWTITGEEPVVQEQVRLPAGTIASRVLRIEFVNHDPRSPADLGLSGDDRKVGLALHTLRIDAVAR